MKHKLLNNIQAYEKVPQAVAQLDDLSVFSIPWGHNALILEKVKKMAELNVISEAKKTKPRKEKG
jgi:hypothetical protein